MKKLGLLDIVLFFILKYNLKLKSIVKFSILKKEEYA